MPTEQELQSKIDKLKAALIKVGEENNLPELSFLLGENSALKAQVASLQERVNLLEDRLVSLGEEI